MNIVTYSQTFNIDDAKTQLYTCHNESANSKNKIFHLEDLPTMKSEIANKWNLTNSFTPSQLSELYPYYENKIQINEINKVAVSQAIHSIQEDQDEVFIYQILAGLFLIFEKFEKTQILLLKFVNFSFKIWYVS